MHSGNIENYSFIHGYHRNNLTGKWFPLHPHTLGRALTHDEMDYNLLYSQQTVAGWRIFGLNADLTLSDDEIGNSLIFHKIRTTDTDYARYVAAGYTEDMYIWITPIYDCTEFYVNGEAFTTSTQRDCSGFVITLSETSPSIDSCDIFGINSTNTSSSKPEGWIYVPKSIGSGSGSGSGGGSGIVPTATPNIGSGSGSGGGSGIVPTATPNIGSGSGSGSGGGSGIVPTPAPTAIPDPTATPVPDPTEVPAPSYMSLSDNTGGEAEEGEIFQFIVETTGIEESASIGYRLGGSAVQDVEYRTVEEVNRQIIYQNKAIIRIEVIKGVGRAIEIILDTVDSQGNKTNDLAHVVKIVAASNVDNPEPTATPVVEPTETPIVEPTATPTEVPTYSLSVNSPVVEGSDMTFTLTTTGLQDGDVVPFGLGGTANVNVDQPWLGDYSPVTPTEFVITNNSATYTVTTYEDNLTESGGNETVSLTLSAFDGQGNGTFSESVTGEIVDTSQNPTATPVPDPTATPVPEPTATSEPINEERENYIFTKCREGDEGDRTIIVDNSEWRTLTGLTEPRVIESTLMNVYTNVCYSYTKTTNERSNIDLRDYQIEKCSCESGGEPEGEPVDNGGY